MKHVSMRIQASKDVELSTRLPVKAWNTPCPHEWTIDCIRSDFQRLTAPSHWPCINEDDRRLLRTLCRCCLRCVPDWQLIVVASLDACFGFPDEMVRGLLFRSVIYLARMDQCVPQSISDEIKHRLAQHLDIAHHPACNIVVDGFLDTIESVRISSDAAIHASNLTMIAGSELEHPR